MKAATKIVVSVRQGRGGAGLRDIIYRHGWLVNNGKGRTAPRCAGFGTLRG